MLLVLLLLLLLLFVLLLLLLLLLLLVLTSLLLLQLNQWKQQVKDAESLDQEYAINQVAVQRQRREGEHDAQTKTLFKLAVNILIGMCVGVTGWTVERCVDLITKARNDAAGSLLDSWSSGDTFWAYCVYVACAIIMVWIAASLVVTFAPAAAGGGVDTVAAYLNGIETPGAFNGVTLLVKFFALILSVASGLPFGACTCLLLLHMMLALRVLSVLRVLRVLLVLVLLPPLR